MTSRDQWRPRVLTSRIPNRLGFTQRERERERTFGKSQRPVDAKVRPSPYMRPEQKRIEPTTPERVGAREKKTNATADRKRVPIRSKISREATRRKRRPRVAAALPVKHTRAKKKKKRRAKTKQKPNAAKNKKQHANIEPVAVIQGLSSGCLLLLLLEGGGVQGAAANDT